MDGQRYDYKEKENDSGEKCEMSEADHSRRKIKIKRMRKNSFKLKKRRRSKSENICDSTVTELSLQNGKNSLSSTEMAEVGAGGLIHCVTSQEVSNSTCDAASGSVFNINSLLDEILSEKKMAFLASAEMVGFLKEHMSLNKSY